MAPGRRETPRYVPCDCPVTPCRAPYRRPNLPCSAPPTTTRAAPFTLLYTRQKITAPLCFLSSPADFAGIRADSPCKRRRAPPRAPRGVAVTRYTAGNSGPRSAVTPEVPAHRRPRGPGAPPSGTHRPHLGAILGETASSAKNLFPTNSFVWGFLKSDSQAYKPPPVPHNFFVLRQNQLSIPLYKFRTTPDLRPPNELQTLSREMNFLGWIAHPQQPPYRAPNPLRPL